MEKVTLWIIVLLYRSSVSNMKARFESGGGDSNASESPPTSLDSANSTNSTNSNSSSAPNSNSSKNHLSATERRRQFRKQALSEGSLKRAATRLSTASLHDTAAEAIEVAETSEVELPLQRRNSIHNVPYVDVNDPETRARMERYKEERRTMLRARYKVEDYKTKKPEDLTKKPGDSGKKPENLKAKEDSRKSRESRASTDSRDSRESREDSDSPSPLPKKQGEGQQKGRLRKDSFGKGKVKGTPNKASSTPRSSGRFSLQQPIERTVVDFKVPLRQMPIEKAPSFKKASVSDFYQNIPSMTTTTRAGNSNPRATPERKWSAPPAAAKREKERTPSPGRLSAVRGSSRNVNNNKERAPSPKSASSAASSRPRNTPSPRLGSSSPSQGQGQAQGQGQNRRPSSFPATTSSNNGDEDVNVKERAAIFGPRKSSGRGKLPGIVNATPGRKKSESASTSSSEAPGSPSKIKNMAALFENA